MMHAGESCENFNSLGLMERRGEEVNGDKEKTDVKKLLGRGCET